MISQRLYILQRMTALLMAPLIVGHLAVMIYAIQGGLTSDEILSRTQGSVPWFLFYGCFVLAVAIHGAIGVRTVLFEWGGLKGRILDLTSWGVCAGLLILGTRAVWVVTWG